MRPAAMHQTHRIILALVAAGAADAFTPTPGGWSPAATVRAAPCRHRSTLLRLRAQHSNSTFSKISEEGPAGSCTVRPQLEPVEQSQRLHSIFRTDGTTWSGPIPRAKRQVFAFPRGPAWGAELNEQLGAPAPLDPASKAMMGALVSALKGGLDLLYQDRTDFARFFVLETVARVPYFAYISALHLYETLGRHRRAAWMKVHYAEADNELHHLLIMEALGGNNDFFDRWIAQHSALAYYWACVGLYLVHPRAAYYIMELIEDHAYKTYSAYVKCNAQWLKTQPAPAIAKKYYESEDMYLFDSFHTAIPKTAGRCLYACACLHLRVWSVINVCVCTSRPLREPHVLHGEGSRDAEKDRGRKYSYRSLPACTQPFEDRAHVCSSMPCVRVYM